MFRKFSTLWPSQTIIQIFLSQFQRMSLYLWPTWPPRCFIYLLEVKVLGQLLDLPWSTHFYFLRHPSYVGSDQSTKPSGMYINLQFSVFSVNENKARINSKWFGIDSVTYLQLPEQYFVKSTFSIWFTIDFTKFLFKFCNRRTTVSLWKLRKFTVTLFWQKFRESNVFLGDSKFFNFPHFECGIDSNLLSFTSLAKNSWKQRLH